MVRRSARLVLLVLAVLSAAGVPTVGFGDADGATGRAAASGPLTTTNLLTTTEVGLTTTTTEATTTEATTTETTTATTTTTTDESLVETTTLSDPVTNTTDEVTNESGELTNGTDETTDETEEVTNESGEFTNETGDSLAAVPTAATDVAVSTGDTSIRLSVTDTSPLVESSSLAGVDGVETTTLLSSGGAPTGGNAGTTTETDGTTTDRESEATDREPGTTAGSSAGSDGPSDRREPSTPQSPSELAAGVGALTAAALLPQLADGLALVGNAGLVSGSSAVVGPSIGTRIRRRVGSRFDRFWRLFTPFRYSRWDDSDPLDHEGREALYEAIERSPGAYLSEVCESAEVPVSTARHHLDVLENEGLVTTAKVRGKRRYYPGRAEDVELVAALADEATAPVLHALARLGDARGGLLADELDRDPSTVSHHLSRLEDAGLVEREREGRAVVNRLSPEVRRVLRGDEETEADAEAPTIAD